MGKPRPEGNITRRMTLNSTLVSNTPRAGSTNDRVDRNGAATRLVSTPALAIIPKYIRGPASKLAHTGLHHFRQQRSDLVRRLLPEPQRVLFSQCTAPTVGRRHCGDTV